MEAEKDKGFDVSKTPDEEDRESTRDRTRQDSFISAEIEENTLETTEERDQEVTNEDSVEKKERLNEEPRPIGDEGPTHVRLKDNETRSDGNLEDHDGDRGGDDGNEESQESQVTPDVSPLNEGSGEKRAADDDVASQRTDNPDESMDDDGEDVHDNDDDDHKDVSMLDDEDAKLFVELEQSLMGPADRKADADAEPPKEDATDAQDDSQPVPGDSSDLLSSSMLSSSSSDFPLPDPSSLTTIAPSSTQAPSTSSASQLLTNAPAWLHRLDSDSGGGSGNSGAPPRSKKEMQEEAREKMQVLISSFSERQLNRYEMFKRSCFPKSTIKRLGSLWSNLLFQ